MPLGHGIFASDEVAGCHLLKKRAPSARSLSTQPSRWRRHLQILLLLQGRASRLGRCRAARHTFIRLPGGGVTCRFACFSRSAPLSAARPGSAHVVIRAPAPPADSPVSTGPPGQFGFANASFKPMSRRAAHGPPLFQRSAADAPRPAADGYTRNTTLSSKVNPVSGELGVNSATPSAGYRSRSGAATTAPPVHAGHRSAAHRKAT